MDLSMKGLKSDQVDDLYGLSLNIAYAIYVEGWQWFNFPESNTPHLLLDAPLPANKVPHKDCAIYVGGDFYVFKDLPKFHENLVKMYKKGQEIADAGFAWYYSHYIEKELNSSEHYKLLHCSADKRCRAILKLYLDSPIIANKMKDEE